MESLFKARPLLTIEENTKSDMTDPIDAHFAGAQSALEARMTGRGMRKNNMNRSMPGCATFLDAVVFFLLLCYYRGMLSKTTMPITSKICNLFSTIAMLESRKITGFGADTVLMSSDLKMVYATTTV